jgi:hypothetical protein
MKKNRLPSEALIKCESSKNKTIFTVECFLYPSDTDKLLNVIFDYVKTSCQKSEDFSKKFNTDLIRAIKN